MRGRTITLTVVDKRGKAAKTIPLYQYDYGQKLLIDGVELPEYYEVHFSNQQYGESVTVLGDSTGVLIPDEMVATGENIYVWLFLHDTSNDGETEYFGVIPVIKRAQPTDITPTPEEQNIITEVIAALNNMEDDMSEQVQAAEAAKEAAQTAQAGAESAATTASGYVDAVAAAQAAAEAAQAAAETAATSATASATSATSSANSANNALSEATNAKIAAVDAASSASTSAASASTASGNAANSANSAEGARVDAAAAAVAAEAAQTASETAQGKAEDAQAAAETAQTGAETAQTAAETAQTAAETAQGKAEDAQAAAEAAASDAEAYAVGTRGGVDVESDDPAYENNAKYYAEAMVGKADLVSDAVEGNFAGLDSEGNLTDSGSKPSDFLTEHQDISGKLDAPSTAGTQGQVLTSDGEGGQAWADPSGAIDDTSGAGDTDVTWSADKLDGEFTDVLTAIQGKPEMKNSSKTGVDLDITDNFGNVVVRFENGHIETKEFNSKKAPQSVNDSALGDLDITDESGNVIARLKDGHIKTKNFDSAELYGVVARNKDIIDGIYAACGWHQPTSTSKQFCLLVSGDCHSEPERMNSLVQFLNSVDAFDAGIMLGDICMTSWENSAEYYTESLQAVQKPFLTVIGNHDAGWARQGQTSNPENGYTNLSDLCAKFITPNIGFADLAEGEYTEGNTYYYKDFTSQKIRIIVLNLYEYPNDINNGTFVYTRGQNCFSQEQITWFCNTLASTPSDYGVIIAQHSASSKMQCDLSSDWVSRMTSAAFQPEDLMDHDTDGWIIPQIVDAWINGSSLTKTFGYAVTGSWTSISVDVDFSTRGTGEFITYIGGHWHATILSNVYGYTDQKSFNVECLSLENAVYGDVPRKAGTRSEDCFCALAVDRTKKTVKLFYIGAHFTRNAVNRQYGQYSYAE